MATKRHSAEQIVRKLREAEVELARGATVKDACRKLAITEHTRYTWRRECVALKLDQYGRQIASRTGTATPRLSPPAATEKTSSCAGAAIRWGK